MVYYAQFSVRGGVLLALYAGHVVSFVVRFTLLGGLFSSCQIRWSFSLWLEFLSSFVLYSSYLVVFLYSVTSLGVGCQWQVCCLGIAVDAGWC